MTRTFDPFREFERIISSATRTPNGASMPMDLYRAGGNYYAQIDLPGVDPESIDIDVEDSTLTLRAVRNTGVEEEGTQWLTRERPSGTFARQLTLGTGVAADRIDAAYSDGVLTLTIPIAEEAKPRKINVQHKDNSATVKGEVADDSAPGGEVPGASTGS